MILFDFKPVIWFRSKILPTISNHWTLNISDNVTIEIKRTAQQLVSNGTAQNQKLNDLLFSVLVQYPYLLEVESSSN